MSIELENKHFDQIAKIHKEMLRDSGFLSYCSQEFISFFYKKIYLDNLNHILVELDEGNDVRGFVFFTEDKDSYIKKFLINNFIKILKYPNSYFPIVKSVVFKLLFSRSKNSLPDYNVEIAQIAVNHEHQGKGIGKKLIIQLEEFLKIRNINEYFLQVYEKNNRAVELYKKSGFVYFFQYNDSKGTKILMKKKIRDLS